MALRCRIVLLAAEGWLNRDVAQRVGLSENTVSMWRRRFVRDRLPGLAELVQAICATMQHLVAEY